MSFFRVVLFFAFSASAQNKHTFVITYIGHVPLVIRSGLYVDALQNDRVFYAASERISISLASRKAVIASDQYIRSGDKPVPAIDLSKIEYRYFIGHEKNNWFPLPFDGLLVDTILRPKEKLVMQFKWKRKDSILQENIFSRLNVAPDIAGYRQKNDFDSIDNSIKSSTVKDNPGLWAGFDSLFGSKLTVSPGKQLELLFRTQRLNLDSSIQYRISDIRSKERTAWQLTGHLLSLHNFYANHDYTLEVRYTGMDSTRIYRILTLPFWYQQSWAFIIFIVLGIVLLTGLPYLFYRRRLRRERQERIRAQEQLQTVQNQLSPHFIVNALGSIEDLVTNGEIELANEYLVIFSEILQYTLENIDRLFISLSEDIAMLEKYMRIEQLRFAFSYQVNFDADLDTTSIELPPMLFQPAIENAVVHAMPTMSGRGTISLDFCRKGKDLSVTIKDNGGKTAKEIKQGHGRGISFTKERIRNLQKLYKKHAIEYHTDHTATGTVVTFYFENWL